MYVGPEEVETILLIDFAVWLEDFSLILLVELALFEFWACLRGILFLPFLWLPPKIICRRPLVSARYVDLYIGFFSTSMYILSCHFTLLPTR